MSYNSLLSFGDLIPLKIKCDVNRLFNEVKEFTYSQYNPRKDISRYGLSITSLDGKLGGVDLDSIKEYNKENNTNYDELSFKEFTDVYFASKEIQKVCHPFLGHIGRSHILHLDEGGFFPPHRDLPVYVEQQNSLRILVPMYEDKPLHFEHGRAYFLNTNKAHNLFAFKDSYMIVLNIETNETVYKIIGDHFQAR